MDQHDKWSQKYNSATVGSSLDAHLLDDGKSLTPQRQLLHETIAQIVSERDISGYKGKDYGTKLARVVNNIQANSAYKKLEQSGDINSAKVSEILDNTDLPKLAVFADGQNSVMVLGGPGTGKTSIVDGVEKRLPDIYKNAAQINPDDYKNILADFDKLGATHAEFTHAESSMIGKKIMDRIEGKLKAGEPVPHVIMDVVSSNDRRMEFAASFDKLVVAAGSAPAEETLERAYLRAKYNADGFPEGRVLNPDIVLEGAQNASKMMPSVFTHPNLEFSLLNTDVPSGVQPSLIAAWDQDNRTLKVHDPDRFMDFVERQNMNLSAADDSEIFKNIDRSAEAVARAFVPYTQKDIAIEFINAHGSVAARFDQQGANVYQALDSHRGSAFISDVAGAFDQVKDDALMHGFKLNVPDNIDDIAFDAKLEGKAQSVKLFKGMSEIAEQLKKAVIPTLIVTGLSLWAQKSAIAGQKDMAEKYLDRGDLTQDQYDQYMGIFEKHETRMLAAAGDPFFGTSMAQDVAVEYALYRDYQAFLNENPNIDHKIAQNLQPGMVSTESLTGVLDQTAMTSLPEDVMQIPESLRPLAQATADLKEAHQAYLDERAKYFSLGFDLASPNQNLEKAHALDPAVRQKYEEFWQAKDAYASEFEKALENPEATKAFVSYIDERQVVDLAAAIAMYDKDTLPPELSAYTDAQKAVLDENPSYARSYNDHLNFPSSITMNPYTLGAVDYGLDYLADKVTTSDLEATRNTTRQVLLDNPNIARDYITDIFASADQPNISVQAEINTQQHDTVERNSVVFLPPNLQALKDRMGGELPEEFQPKIPTGTPLYHLDAVQNWELQIREENNLPFIHLSTGLLRANDPYVDFDEVEIRDFQNTLADPDLSQDVIDLIETGYPAGMERLRSEELERLDKAAGQKLDDLYRLDWQKQQAEFDTRQEHPAHMGLE